MALYCHQCKKSEIEGLYFYEVQEVTSSRNIQTWTLGDTVEAIVLSDEDELNYSGVSSFECEFGHPINVDPSIVFMESDVYGDDQAHPVFVPPPPMPFIPLEKESDFI